MSKRTISIVVGLGLAGVAAGLSLSLSLRLATAAYFERVSGVSCRPAEMAAQSHTYWTDISGAMLRNQSASAASVLCRIPDKSTLPSTSLTSIKVQVKDSNPAASVTIKACAFNGTSGTGGACGTAEQTSVANQNYEERTLSTTAELQEIDAGEQPYIWISLPGSSGGNMSGVGGLYYYMP